MYYLWYVDPEIRFTRHARERMVLRGVSTKEVLAAISGGAKSRLGARIVSRYRYFEVVYVVHRGRITVITVIPRW